VVGNVLSSGDSIGGCRTKNIKLPKDFSMHVSRHDLERLVVDQLPNPELSALQVHLQECRACQVELTAKLDEEEAAGNPQVNSNTAARIKVLNPITSNGPSGPAHLMNASAHSLHVRVPRLIFIGALVHVRSSIGITFGHVRYCIPAGSEFQIGVKLQAAR
jgi:hypothetical protein